jgi:AraC-like DNA-binding protein
MDTYFFDISVVVSHTLKTVRIRRPNVIWVRAGAKSVVTPQRAEGLLQVQAGGLCLLSAGHQWDVSNHIGPSGRYAASVWAIPDAVADAFAQHYPALASQPPLHGFATTTALDDWPQTWERAQRAAAQGLSASAVHRGVELLLTLAERRLVFPSRVQLSWTDRVTNLIAQRPHADWSVDALAQHFLLSGSTLRQRLQDEDSNVTACLREVRLELGLSLLQSTEIPIGQISQRCGYESHSRFTAAFRSRFGLSPSSVRTADIAGVRSRKSDLAQQTSASG